MRTHRLAVIMLLLGAAGRAAADEQPWTFGADLGLGYDSNVGNAQYAADVRGSSFAAAAVSAERTLPLEGGSQLAWRGSLGGERVAQVTGLSHSRAAVGVRWAQRLGSEFIAPTVTAALSADYAEYASDLRDSTGLRFTGSVLQQLTTQLSARASVTAAWRDSDSEVFDLHQQGLGVHLDWAAGPRLWLFGGYDLQTGQIVSTASPVLSVIRWAEAIEPDDAFGGQAAGKFAYRLRAHTHSGTLGFNVALGQHLALDARGQYFAAAGTGRNRYERWLASASLLASF